MFFDLSPYLSFNAFVTLWIVLLLTLACVGSIIDDKEGK